MDSYFEAVGPKDHTIKGFLATLSLRVMLRDPLAGNGFGFLGLRLEAFWACGRSVCVCMGGWLSSMCKDARYAENMLMFIAGVGSL